MQQKLQQQQELTMQARHSHCCDNPLALYYIRGIQYVGDLSLQDADILAYYARLSGAVLEFGCGGSTQIFAQLCRRVVSVETDYRWVEITQQRLAKIPTAYPVEFCTYGADLHNEQFDLVFVDGVDDLRRQFAIDAWRLLSVGGVMIFHDTRRFHDFQNAAWVAQLFFSEIEHIDVNAKASNSLSSNMTVIVKKKHEPYENWNESEGKPAWAYGDPNYTGDIPSWV